MPGPRRRGEGHPRRRTRARSTTCAGGRWAELVDRRRPRTARSLSPWAVAQVARARRAGARRRPAGSPATAPSGARPCSTAPSSSGAPSTLRSGARGRPADALELVARPVGDLLAAFLAEPRSRSHADRSRAGRSSPTRSVASSAPAASGCARRSCTGAIAPRARRRRCRDPPRGGRRAAAHLRAAPRRRDGPLGHPPRPSHRPGPVVGRAIAARVAAGTPAGSARAQRSSPVTSCTCGPTSSSHRSPFPPQPSNRARAVFTTLREEVIAGQHLDLLLAADPAADEASARHVALLKSARYTVTRPLLLGAALAPSADGRAGRAAPSWPTATPSGLAFQLRDDILGLFGDPCVTGKSDLDDLHEGKRTVAHAPCAAAGRPDAPAVAAPGRARRSRPRRGRRRSRARGRRGHRCPRLGRGPRSTAEHARALEAIDELPASRRAAPSSTWRSSRSGDPHDPRRRHRCRARGAVRGVPPRRRRSRRHGPRGRRGARRARRHAWRATASASTPGPTVLTMPHLIDRCFAAAGVDGRELLTLRPVDPMYRACFADGSELRVRHGREAMTEEIRAVCGDREAEAFGRFCDWLARLYELEMPRFIERSYDSPLDLASPLGPALELVRLGGFRRLAKVVVGLLRRRAAPAHLQLPVDVRRPGALRGARALRGDHLHGHRQRRVRARGRHARASGGAGHGRRAGRCHVPLRRRRSTASSCGRARAAPSPACASADGEVVDADAVVANPDLPVAYRTLLPGLPMPRAARRGHYSPSALVWHVGVRGELPAGTEHHNIHFGGDWDGAFRAILRDGVRMPDPSLLVSVPSLHEPTMAPAGAHALYVLEPMPNLDGRIDWTDARPQGPRRPVPPPRAPRLPDRHRRRGARRPARLGARRAWSEARRSRCRTGSARPARSGPATSSAGLRAWCSPARARCPGVGVPMVLVSGMLAAERVEQMAPDDRHPRRELRPLPRAQQALRHHVLLVDVRAAARQAPPRVGALRLLPPRRRHRRRPGPGRRSRCARRRWPTSATASSPTSTAGRLRRPGAQGRRAHRARLRHRPRVLPPVPALDGDGPHRHARTRRGTTCCGYMDGSAAVIGEMMLPILEPLGPGRARAGPRPRQRVPAHQLPPRRRRGPRPRSRLPAPGGPRSLRCRSARRHRAIDAGGAT